MSSQYPPEQRQHHDNSYREGYYAQQPPPPAGFEHPPEPQYAMKPRPHSPGSARQQQPPPPPQQYSSNGHPNDPRYGNNPRYYPPLQQQQHQQAPPRRPSRDPQQPPAHRRPSRDAQQPKKYPGGIPPPSRTKDMATQGPYSTIQAYPGSRSQPDLSSGMKDMSIRDHSERGVGPPPRSNSAVPSHRDPHMMMKNPGPPVAPYASNARPASPGGPPMAPYAQPNGRPASPGPPPPPPTAPYARPNGRPASPGPPVAPYAQPGGRPASPGPPQPPTAPYAQPMGRPASPGPPVAPYASSRRPASPAAAAPPQPSQEQMAYNKNMSRKSPEKFVMPQPMHYQDQVPPPRMQQPPSQPRQDNNNTGYGHSGAQYYDEPTSPPATAVSSDEHGERVVVSPREGRGDTKISTNKIPPSSTVVSPNISSLAEEYRRDLMVSPTSDGSRGNDYPSAYDREPPSPHQMYNGNGPVSPSSAKTDELVNMYLDEVSTGTVSSERGQISDSSDAHYYSHAPPNGGGGYSSSLESIPPLNPNGQAPYQSNIQPLRKVGSVPQLQQNNQRPPPQQAPMPPSQHHNNQQFAPPQPPPAMAGNQRMFSPSPQQQPSYHHGPPPHQQQPRQQRPPPIQTTGPPPQAQAYVVAQNQMPIEAAVDRKPPPRRQYTSSETSNEIEKSKGLTVEEFESFRQQARNRSHDPRIQLELAKKLVEACTTLANKYSDANTPSRSGYSDPKAERKNKEMWTAQAYKITKKMAHAQYHDAMFFLASNYSSGGLGLEIDYDKAYELYSKAAKMDHAEAGYRVAVCNELGAGTKKDTQKALMWYRKAAHLGDVSAMYKLGMISLKGYLGQPKSFAEAVTWLQRAAEKADSDTPHAVHELGLLYERVDNLDMSAVNDIGTATVIQRDERRAFELFLKAAKLGYPPSQFRLGCSYEYGTLNCGIDPKRSIAWYSKAAEKGEPESELALSGWYLTGSEGILQQSDTEAYLWARRAAEKGLAKAEYALGYFTEVGIGVRSDIDEARRWYLKAAAQKHPKALTRLQEMKDGQ